MRVTRVDACGRPIYGVGAQVVTSGFVSVAMSGEILEGTEIEQRNANGELCLSEKDADQLKWLTVESTLCEVDPDLMSLFQPNNTKLLDYQGNTIGFAESDLQNLSVGVAVEIWANVSGEDLCDDPDATESYAYLLMPWVVGGTMGDLTVENAGMSVSLNSRTKRNSKWGVGPHEVMFASLGVEGPLLVPVGPREHRRLFVTTVPPPAAVCGAQPLSNPEGPAFTLIEGATPLTSTVTTALTGQSVDWGDGSPPEPLVAATPLSHVYVAGTYHVSVYATIDTNDVTVQTHTVPWP
jgi:hypothetical protein